MIEDKLMVQLKSQLLFFEKWYIANVYADH